MSNCLLKDYTKEQLKEIVESSYSYKEVLKKVGYTTFNGRNTDTLKKYLEKYDISPNHFEYISSVERTENNVFCKNSTATQTTLRRWYVKGNYSDYKCAICGQEPIWNDLELKLQLDHIDGDNKNNELANLRWLCPNCHSQTDTFCGKGNREGNKKERKNYCIYCGKEIGRNSIKCADCANLQRRKTERPSKDQLIKELKEANFSIVGRKYGVSDNAVRKWCRQYSIPDKAKDYKQLNI